MARRPVAFATGFCHFWIGDTMQQVTPENYAHDEDGNTSEEYVADQFRWLPSPELDKPLHIKRMPKARRDKLSHQRTYLAAFAETGNKRLSCGAAGITRQSVWLWEQEEGSDGDEFRRLLALATEQAVETLEAEARRRAVHGTRKIKRGYNKDGDLTYEHIEIDYSDTLMIFLLKGAAPDKYAERAKVNITIQQEVERLATEFGLDPADVMAEATAILKASRT